MNNERPLKTFGTPLALGLGAYCVLRGVAGGGLSGLLKIGLGAALLGNGMSRLRARSVHGEKAVSVGEAFAKAIDGQAPHPGDVPGGAYNVQPLETLERKLGGA